MTLETKIKQVIEENTALKEAANKSSSLLSLVNQKIAELSERVAPRVLPELRELQLINLGAQAEIYEQTHENTLIMFQAIAEIYELIGVDEE